MEFITERMEDYLRAIYELEKSKGYARVKDISCKLSVKPSSAVEMLRKLEERGLVTHEKYGAVRLTERGRELAEVVEKRYNYIRRFLEMLLVPEDAARRDAHILEHGLHPKTILQIIRFVDFIDKHRDHPRSITAWLRKFERYCKEVEQKEQ
ncbi:metal-dependent transcriptional regulator [Infirmifilum sp. NZ]|uniref:metal-dependent transcriptional regulator n=1 Tax=Infirmifilum sp. NZ TaxID=2926850 RepID=UPI0027AAEC92|nr:metal-dependent transcriptional regulator [Infirmifilum sp. NZ]UNQ73543.1 metal-dependent transcriptional regulator [Infirmifilum sp. NZ]